ncbi:hypothetical protein [Streptomyces sp. NPDC017524]|uniref:hypothetical protein n=1 Tax=Streptomyces sp. NPDC017524 TaxID=3364999 RepID=UPI0037B2A4CA
MPSLPPPRTTELFYGGAWHTAKVRESSPLTITRGVSAEGTAADPSAASQTLDNRSGHYSPRNPKSPLFGKFGRNTPWRVSVQAGGPWASLPGTGSNRLTTPHHANLAITSDLDLRLDVALDSWREEMALAARYETVGDQRSWLLLIQPTGHLRLLWSPDGTFASLGSATSTEPVPAYRGQRLCLRVTLDVNNGGGGKSVTFSTGQQLTGRWTPLGTRVTTAGTTTIFNPTSGLQLGDVPGYNVLEMRGRLHGLQLRNGIDGPLTVDLNVATAPPGASSFADSTGREWTTWGGAALTNVHTRMVGEVPAWPVSRDLSGADRTVAIAPAGIMRRLGAGNRPLDSVLRRFLISAQPLECWPLTDGAQATGAASLRGSAPALVAADQAQPLWGEGELANWLEGCVTFPLQTSGSLRAVPAATGTASWSVDIFRAGRGQNEWTEITDRGTGTTADPRHLWSIYCQTVPNRILMFCTTTAAEAISVAFLGDLLSPGIYDDLPHHLRFTTTVSGGDTFWQMWVDGELKSLSVEPFAGKPIRQVDLRWDLVGPDAADVSMGYLTLWNSTGPDTATVHEAFHGLPGESAGARILRLSDEHGVPVSVAGAEATQTRLGIQRPDRYLDTLATIAKSDLGILFERRDDRELVYRSRSTLYSQDPVLTLDWTKGLISEPFRPTDDDKNTENDIAVTRDGGATSPRAVLETGRMSVQDPPDGVGRYDEDYTLSLEADHQTGEHAQWRMHLGTFDGLRFTKITLNLANPRVYALIDDIYRADVGDLMRLTNLPDDYGPGDVDLIIRGYTEEISADRWTITFNCGPGAPWQVGVVEDPVLGRADTDGSELAAPVTASATTMSIATTAGPVWVSDQREYPFDLTVGGEVVTAVGIGTVLHSNPLLLDGLAGWSGLSSTIALDTTVVHTGLDAAASIRVTPSGASSASLLPAARSAVGSVTPGASYTMSAWVYTPGGWPDMRILGDWYTAADTMLSTTASVAIPVPAGVWTYISLTATAPAGASRAGLRARIGVSPTAGDLSYWWALRMVPDATVSASSPQELTVIRSRNGITKPHPVGTALSLTHPMRAAL